MAYGVGNLIRAWIEFKKLSNLSYTQRELGEAAGIDPNYISQIVSGHRKNPRRNTMIRFARALGITLEELYQGPPVVNGVPVESLYPNGLSPQDILIARIQKRLSTFQSIDLLEIVYRQIVFYGELENHVTGENIHGAFNEAFRAAIV